MRENQLHQGAEEFRCITGEMFRPALDAAAAVRYIRPSLAAGCVCFPKLPGWEMHKCNSLAT